jgi:oligopeptide/dipeptide ABC transporter ATP-binding protein
MDREAGEVMGRPRDHGDVVLSIHGLTTHLRTKKGVVRAVNGVDLELRQGETLGIVGESGSGKTMLALSVLKMLPRPAGHIVAGSITLAGEELTNKSEAEMARIRGKRIAMILQDPQTSLNPVFRIGDQIAEAVQIHGQVDDRRTIPDRVMELLRRVGIADPARRTSNYPHEMSGGMKQRVVGAIAISCTPDVIIADEPTTSLDLTIQSQYLRLLRQIQHDTGVAIVFITHDFGIVAKMCSRVAVLYAGKIVERGLVRSIFNSPSHPYTDALMRSVPKVEKRVDRLYSISGQPPPPGSVITGCPFAPRCDFADDRCRQEYPPTFRGLSGSDDHLADCWRLEDPSWKPRVS